MNCQTKDIKYQNIIFEILNMATSKLSKEARKPQNKITVERKKKYTQEYCYDDMHASTNHNKPCQQLWHL